MKIFALGDLHLSFKADKSMEIFGENWKEHYQQIGRNWWNKVSPEDLVLIPGDISWAMNTEEALPDLEWIDALPGKKLILKGNHDFWWPSTMNKLKKILPPSISPLQGNSYISGKVVVVGSRLWENPDLDFDDYIHWKSRESLGLAPKKNYNRDDHKIWQKEMKSLTKSLESITTNADKIIALFHFPPVDFSFRENEIIFLLQKYGVNICIFSHLHSLKKNKVPFFPLKKWNMEFHLVSSDFVDFSPVRIL